MEKLNKERVKSRAGEECEYCGIYSFSHVHEPNTLPKDFKIVETSDPSWADDEVMDKQFNPHEHQWQFVDDYRNGIGEWKFKFICHCGAMKDVKCYEIKE